MRNKRIIFGNTFFFRTFFHFKKIFKAPFTQMKFHTTKKQKLRVPFINYYPISQQTLGGITRSSPVIPMSIVKIINRLQTRTV